MKKTNEETPFAPSVSDEEMVRIAADLGLELTFNSPTPGIYNTTTGQHLDFEDIMPNFDWLDDPEK